MGSKSVDIGSNVRYFTIFDKHATLGVESRFLRYRDVTCTPVLEDRLWDELLYRGISKAAA